MRPWARGPALTFVATHLDHTRDETDRLRQAGEINRIFVDGGPGPILLAGDLNAVPTSETIRHFTPHWHDAAADAGGPTVPAGNPRSRIDYVMPRPPAAWKVVETKVIDEPVASDHRPVLAVVEWLGATR